MSFIFSLERDTINKGDFVIAYISPEDLTVIKVEFGASLHNRLGLFKHSDMIGKAYGSQVWSHDGGKHLHLLRPTPELWTRVLPHRTQILYLPDISFILEMLEVNYGSIIVESGTGSGSFSHSIARAIGRGEGGGHLYTFDFHKERVLQAQKEFEEHGLIGNVTVECRDVCNDDGFNLIEVANAVFLDLPSPWLAISNAKKTLRRDCCTRIACFSPCMEQVQRTIPELKANGFCEIEMYEIVSRPLEVEEISITDNLTTLPCSVERTLGQKRPIKETLHVAKHKSDIKGHTSYLYFASLLATV